MTASGRTGADTALIAALAAGCTHAAAAEQAGVSERTVRRRLDDPAFRQQVEAARAEILDRAVAELTSAAVEAVEALRTLLGSEADYARLGAARAILEVGLRYRAQLDLAERVAALEADRPKGDPTWKPRAV